MKSLVTSMIVVAVFVTGAAYAETHSVAGIEDFDALVYRIFTNPADEVRGLGRRMPEHVNIPAYVDALRSGSDVERLLDAARQSTAEERARLADRLAEAWFDVYMNPPEPTREIEPDPPSPLSLGGTYAPAIPIVLYEAGYDRRALLGLFARVNEIAQQASRAHFQRTVPEGDGKIDPDEHIGGPTVTMMAYTAAQCFEEWEANRALADMGLSRAERAALDRFIELRDSERRMEGYQYLLRYQGDIMELLDVFK